MKKILLAFASIALVFGIYSWTCAPANSQTPPDDKGIHWLTWDEARAQFKKDSKNPKIKHKKVVIDFYTDWCGWCKRMEATTFQDTSVARFVNENYYPIRFNAEQKGDIQFDDNTVYKFRGDAGRGTHELAINLLNGQLSYPTIVFMDENFKLIQAVPGYQDAKMFRMIASYFSGDYHKTTAWDVYSKNYVAPK